MKNGIFEDIPIESFPNSKFDLSHSVTLTGNAADIIPVLMEECLPGDNFRWRPNLKVRLAPTLAPVMANLKASIYLFHVPNRILTTTFKNFISGGEQGTSVDSLPTVNMNTLLQAGQALGNSQFDLRFASGSLWDYIGLPPQVYNASPAVYVDTTTITILPFIAYQCVWQYYFKDQNVDTSLIMKEPIGGGTISTTPILNDYLVLRKAAWRKDPFTSSLPTPQRGPAVLLPVQGPGVVTYLATSKVKDSAGTLIATSSMIGTDVGPSGDLKVNKPAVGTAGVQGRIENIDTITFSNNSITISDFRTAVVFQRFLEANARGGGRYGEVILSQFDEVVPDFLIDQPDFVGGMHLNVRFTEVLTTAYSEDAAAAVVPPANMAGHGLGISSGNMFTYRAREHGWMLAVLVIRPETAYQQGLHKKFTRITRNGFAWPIMTGLGEQPILSKELFYNAQDATATNDTLFGYQQQHWEYKTTLNRTCGDFRGNLSFWTMTRIFSTRPTLNTSFIYADPTTRIFAVQGTSHKYWMEVYHELSVLRKLPYYSVPGITKI